MSVFTFTNAAADGDLANTANWNVGGSPAGALPTSSDTAVLDNQTLSSGSGFLIAPVTSATNAILNGGTFSNNFSGSAVTYNNGSFFGTVDFGTGSTLNADPGVNFTAAGTTFTNSATFSHLTVDNGGCTYEAGCTFNGNFALGNGSIVNGGQFNATMTTVTSGTPPTIIDGNFAAASVFTATLISGGTFAAGITLNACTVTGGSFVDGVTFQACTISAGTFGSTSTGCTVTGASTISGGAWSKLTVNSDVAFSGSPTFSISLTIHYIRGPYTYSANISNVTISVPDPGYPAQADVKSGTSVGDIGDGAGPLYTGTLTSAASGIGSGRIRRR